MEAAYKILKELLASVFGFHKVLWVFSGRRGMHAWVCDESARGLESIERKSVTNFLNVSVNSDMSDRLVVPEALEKLNSHQIFKTCKEVLYGYESFLFEEQCFLSHKERGEGNYERVLSVLKRHYKEMDIVFNREGYLKLRKKILETEEGASGSIAVFKGMLKRYAADLASQKGRSVDQGIFFCHPNYKKFFKFYRIFYKFV